MFPTCQHCWTLTPILTLTGYIVLHRNCCPLPGLRLRFQSGSRCPMVSSTTWWHKKLVPDFFSHVENIKPWKVDLCRYSEGHQVIYANILLLIDTEYPSPGTHFRLERTPNPMCHLCIVQKLFLLHGLLDSFTGSGDGLEEFRFEIPG